MAKTEYMDNGILDLIFTKKKLVDLATATGGDTATQDEFFLSLHTSTPGEEGDQTTNETSYTSYARVAVARSVSGFAAATAGATFLVATASFPQCTGSTATITHAGVGTATSGAGTLLYSGTVTPNLSVSNGVTPRLTTSSTITED